MFEKSRRHLLPQTLEAHQSRIRSAVQGKLVGPSLLAIPSQNPCGVRALALDLSGGNPRCVSCATQRQSVDPRCTGGPKGNLQSARSARGRALAGFPLPAFAGTSFAGMTRWGDAIGWERALAGTGLPQCKISLETARLPFDTPGPRAYIRRLTPPAGLRLAGGFASQA